VSHARLKQAHQEPLVDDAGGVRVRCDPSEVPTEDPGKRRPGAEELDPVGCIRELYLTDVAGALRDGQRQGDRVLPFRQ